MAKVFIVWKENSVERKRSEAYKYKKRYKEEIKIRK